MKSKKSKSKSKSRRKKKSKAKSSKKSHKLQSDEEKSFHSFKMESESNNNAASLHSLNSEHERPLAQHAIAINQTKKVKKMKNLSKFIVSKGRKKKQGQSPLIHDGDESHPDQNTGMEEFPTFSHHHQESCNIVFEESNQLEPHQNCHATSPPVLLASRTTGPSQFAETQREISGNALNQTSKDLSDNIPRKKGVAANGAHVRPRGAVSKTHGENSPQQAETENRRDELPAYLRKQMEKNVQKQNRLIHSILKSPVRQHAAAESQSRERMRAGNQSALEQRDGDQLGKKAEMNLKSLN